MGYKPSENGGFELKEGIFYKFVNKAKDNPEKKYVFIIDEINRGNLSRIFGELLFLIESDKREEKYSLKLTYSDKEFYVPDNLYIIGTMNTADRSLALVDYALRRRFVFKTLDPILDIEKNKKLEKYFKVHGFKNKEIDDMKNRLKKINELNDEINNDLGKGFKIGHSYFLSLDDSKDIKKWYENVIEYEIKPLLEEYYFDEQENEIEKKIKSLKDTNNSEDN
jgi:5-methylcytosine-specific restriction endonuclease McrBC GTP-binding regulatory subunit McrB